MSKVVSSWALVLNDSATTTKDSSKTTSTQSSDASPFHLAVRRGELVELLPSAVPLEDKLLVRGPFRTVGLIPKDILSRTFEIGPQGRAAIVITSNKHNSIAVAKDDFVLVTDASSKQGDRRFEVEAIHCANQALVGKRGLVHEESIRLLPTHRLTATMSADELSSSSDNANGPASSISSDELTSYLCDIAKAQNLTRIILFMLLLAPGYRLLTVLCDVAEGTSLARLAKDIIDVHKRNSKIPELLDAVIDIETERTTAIPLLIFCTLVHPATFFRDNMLTSHLMSVYSHREGRDYIKLVLKGLVKCTTFHDVESLEIDPLKVNTQVTSLEENVAKLTDVVQMFLDVIIQSLSQLPKIFRYLCFRLRTRIGTKFPESKYSCIGGFFFLRFLCPAIVAPESYGLIDGIGKSRRPLVLVSKVLQTIANGVEFGKKEPYMIPMNSFIQSNTAKVHHFFDQLSTMDGITEPLLPEREGGGDELDFKKAGVMRIYREVHYRMPDIRKMVDAASPGSDIVGLYSILSFITSQIGTLPDAAHDLKPEDSQLTPALTPRMIAHFRRFSRDARKKKDKDPKDPFKENEKDKDREKEKEKEKETHKDGHTDLKRSFPGEEMRVSLPVIAVKKATGDRTYLTLSDDVISMAGWLAMKVSTGMKLRHKWKVFWFKLVDTEMYYYKSAAATNKLGVVELEKCIAMESWSPQASVRLHKVKDQNGVTSMKTLYPLELVYSDRVIHLAAHSGEELATWAKSLHQVNPSCNLLPSHSNHSLGGSGSTSIDPRSPGRESGSPSARSSGVIQKLHGSAVLSETTTRPVDMPRRKASSFSDLKKGIKPRAIAIPAHAASDLGPSSAPLSVDCAAAFESSMLDSAGGDAGGRRGRSGSGGSMSARESKRVGGKEKDKQDKQRKGKKKEKLGKKAKNRNPSGSQIVSKSTDTGIMIVVDLTRTTTTRTADEEPSSSPSAIASRALSQKVVLKRVPHVQFSVNEVRPMSFSSMAVVKVCDWVIGEEERARALSRDFSASSDSSVNPTTTAASHLNLSSSGVVVRRGPSTSSPPAPIPIPATSSLPEIAGATSSPRTDIPRNLTIDYAEYHQLATRTCELAEEIEQRKANERKCKTSLRRLRKRLKVVAAGGDENAVNALRLVDEELSTLNERLARLRAASHALREVRL